jgi:hypothetical protein
MPISKFRFTPDRVDFSAPLAEEDVYTLIEERGLKVLQCSNPVDFQTWELLNSQFFTRRPDVQLRVYGFYLRTCDLSFASIMTNVRHFSADCLMGAEGVEHIAAMEKLESLGVGIFHLQGFEFLNHVTPHLKKLFLGATESKKPDLSPLRRFQSREAIYIEGQQKNIEVLSQMENLEDVTLRSISTPDISYLKPLHHMWSLDIKLGGIKNFSALEGMKNIKYLELWQIRGLSDINFVSGLFGLQYLFLQSLRQVVSLPSFERLDHLRRIYLENMKGLRDILSLEHAPALQELAMVSATNMKPDDCTPFLLNPNLRRVSCFFGSNQKNNRFKELAREYKVEAMNGLGEFHFI